MESIFDIGLSLVRRLDGTNVGNITAVNFATTLQPSIWCESQDDLTSLSNWQKKHHCKRRYSGPYRIIKVTG